MAASDLESGAVIGRLAAWQAVGVYAFASAVFLAAMGMEAVAHAAAPLSEILPLSSRSVAEPGAELVASVLRWRTATVLLLGTVVGGIGFGLVMFLQAWRTERAAALAIRGLAGVVGLGAWLIQLAGPTSYLVELVQVARSDPAGVPPLAELVLLPKRVAEVAAGGVGVGLASVLVLPSNLSPSVLAAHVRQLRIMLYVSAAMLVAGVLLAQTAYAWAAATFGVGEEWSRVVRHGTHLTAAFYTVVLAAAYIPASMHLSWWGERLADDATSRDGGPDRDAVRRACGLSDALTGQVLRLGAVVSPILSSAVPDLAQVIGG